MAQKQNFIGCNTRVTRFAFLKLSFRPRYKVTGQSEYEDIFFYLKFKFWKPASEGRSWKNKPIFVILTFSMPLMNSYLMRSMLKWPNIRSRSNSESAWQVLRLHLPFHGFGWTFPGCSRTPSVPELKTPTTDGNTVDRGSSRIYGFLTRYRSSTTFVCWNALMFTPILSCAECIICKTKPFMYAPNLPLLNKNILGMH